MTGGAPLPLSALLSSGISRAGDDLTSPKYDRGDARILPDPNSPFPLLQQADNPSVSEIAFGPSIPVKSAERSRSSREQ